MHKAIFDKTMKTLFNIARTRGVAFFLSSLVLLFAVGCQRYTIIQTYPRKIVKIGEEGSENKHFIVHAGGNLYDLTNVARGTKLLTGTVQAATEPIYYSTTRKKPYTKAEAGILNEVHIVLNSKYDSLALGAFTVPLKDISDVRVINKSTPLKTFAVVVVSIGLVGLISIIGLISGLNSGK